jgi:hypothetical protein
MTDYKHDGTDKFDSELWVQRPRLQNRGRVGKMLIKKLGKRLLPCMPCHWHRYIQSKAHIQAYQKVIRGSSILRSAEPHLTPAPQNIIGHFS